jgi:hypothetical protein
MSGKPNYLASHQTYGIRQMQCTIGKTQAMHYVVAATIGQAVSRLIDSMTCMRA